MTMKKFHQGHCQGAFFIFLLLLVVVAVTVTVVVDGRLVSSSTPPTAADVVDVNVVEENSDTPRRYMVEAHDGPIDMQDHLLRNNCNNNGDPDLNFKGSDPSQTPLGRCEGDCDDDNDCQGSLICFEKDKNEFNGHVPGCNGRDTSRNDYCIRPGKQTTFCCFVLLMNWIE